eukprot:SM003905S14717  [mRNA]  locus=s3905:724:1288:- [translate_table: standard]
MLGFGVERHYYALSQSRFSKRLVELLAAQAPESLAAAAVTLCTFSGVNADCRILLAQEPWVQSMNTETSHWASSFVIDVQVIAKTPGHY